MSFTNHYNKQLGWVDAMFVFPIQTMQSYLVSSMRGEEHGKNVPQV